MEIVNKKAAFLSNYEVYNLLKEVKEKQDSKTNKNAKHQKVDKHLPTVVYESLKYLEKTACVNQTPDAIREFLAKCEQYKLTKIEKLQLLNQRPATAVELQLLIEDSEERFTIEQMDELLEFLNSTLPSKEPADIPQQE